MGTTVFSQFPRQATPHPSRLDRDRRVKAQASECEPPGHGWQWIRKEKNGISYSSNSSTPSKSWPKHG
eukprot:16451623-Heterocapsa_arctica.AAC.1